MCKLDLQTHILESMASDHERNVDRTSGLDRIVEYCLDLEEYVPGGLCQWGMVQHRNVLASPYCKGRLDELVGSSTSPSSPLLEMKLSKRARLSI
jgi:hypothetical protein